MLTQLPAVITRQYIRSGHDVAQPKWTQCYGPLMSQRKEQQGVMVTTHIQVMVPWLQVPWSWNPLGRHFKMDWNGNVWTNKTFSLREKSKKELKRLILPGSPVRQCEVIRRTWETDCFREWRCYRESYFISLEPWTSMNLAVFPKH